MADWTTCPVCGALIEKGSLKCEKCGTPTNF